MEHQFRLWQLFVFVSSFALVLGIASHNAIAAVFACPMIVGGVVGAWRSHCWRGMVTGVLAGCYWSLPVWVVGLASGFAEATLAVVLFTGILGGYLGGVVESSV
jgi:hypothetical protein